MTNKSLIGRLLLLSLLLLPSKLYAQISTTTCPGAGCITQNVASQGSVGIQITGTFVGTITFYGSINNSTYVAINLFPPTSAVGTSTTTTTGLWSGSIAGLSSIRVGFSAYTSGSATVTIRTQQSAKGGIGGGGGGGACAALASDTDVLFVSSGQCAGTADFTWIPIGSGNASGGGGLLVGPIAADTGGWAYGQSFNVARYATDATAATAIFSSTIDLTTVLANPSEAFGFVNEIFNNNHNVSAGQTALYTTAYYGAGTGTIPSITATRNGATQYSGTVTDFVAGTVSYAEINDNSSGNGTAALISAFYGQMLNTSNGTVTKGVNYYGKAPSNTGTMTTFVGNWNDAFAGVATNVYSFWSDEAGVYRIRSDNTFNSVYQAIPALYNPQITKYTPGAANYERCIPGCQWESNVATYTTEKGGTGTLRAMNLGDTGVQVKINSQNITLAGALTTSGANALTLTTTGATNVTFPTSGTLLNSTATGIQTFLTTPSSANLAAAVTDETGSGLLVFATTPTLTTPVLGVATATSVNKVAFTAPASSATLTIADGKTLTDTSGVGAVLLKGATGGGFAAAVASDIPATTLAAGTSVSLTAPRQYYVCTGTCTVTPPVPVAGYEFCVMNDDNVATVITMAALGSSSRYEVTARSSYGTAGTGTMVSGGAIGDKVCIIGRDSTHYLTSSYNGVWTVN